MLTYNFNLLFIDYLLLLLKLNFGFTQTLL